MIMKQKSGRCEDTVIDTEKEALVGQENHNEFLFLGFPFDCHFRVIWVN